MRSCQRKVRVGAYWPYHSKRELDSARRNAAYSVRAAIKAGTLKRQQRCERCPIRRLPGPRATVEAHHEDYSKPLDVMWLCRRHHRERHAEIGRRLASPGVWPSARRAYQQHLMAAPSVEPLVRSVTEQVLAVMDAERLTQIELGKRIGSSRQHVNTIMHGGVRTLKLLAAIADAIGCDVSFSLTKRDEAKAS